MSTPTSQLREEFLANEELAGKNGYCNEVMAGKIADWWLSKLSEALKKRREAVEGLTEDWIAGYISKKDVLSILSE